MRHPPVGSDFLFYGGRLLGFPVFREGENSPTNFLICLHGGPFRRGQWPPLAVLGASWALGLPRRRKFVGAFFPSRKTGGVIGQPLGALGAVLGASWASGRPRRSPRPHVYERRGPGPHGERGSGGGRGAFSARSPPIGFVFGPWWGALGLSGGLLWLSRSARACRRHSAPGGVPGTS